MANDTNRLSFTFDANLQMKDAGLIAASAITQVNGSNVLIDVGDAEFRGWLRLNVTAIETDSSNELYTVVMQGCSRGVGSTRDAPVVGTTVQNLAEIDLGHSAVRKGTGANTSATGVYLLPFRNVVLDTTLPILRCYVNVAGTIVTGINFDAYIGKMAY